MNRIEKTYAIFRSLQKYIALSAITLSVLYFFLGNPALATMHLLSGLYLLLTSTEKTEDERSTSLRVTSLYVALVLAYTIKLIISFLNDQQLIGFKITDVDHFIIMVLLIANILYYLRLYTGKP